MRKTMIGWRRTIRRKSLIKAFASQSTRALITLWLGWTFLRLVQSWINRDKPNKLISNLNCVSLLMTSIKLKVILWAWLMKLLILSVGKLVGTGIIEIIGRLTKWSDDARLRSQTKRYRLSNTFRQFKLGLDRDWRWSIDVTLYFKLGFPYSLEP